MSVIRVRFIEDEEETKEMYPGYSDPGHLCGVLIEPCVCVLSHS